METFDLFDLHDALFKAARANHITLDMSEHKDKVEGLPFNLTFVVRNKKAQIKCPRCGSQNTARYVGMGGAMSALGGDMSVMGTNPAGLGIYRSNDIALSFGFNNNAAESNFNGTIMKQNQTRASLDQVGFVYTNKIGNTTSLRFVNFGFNYHKSRNFNRLFSAGGVLDGMSQTNYLADELDAWGMDSPSKFDEVLNSQNPYTNYWNKYPVLGIMGITTGLVDYPDDTTIGWNGDSNDFYSRETGGINQYDFSVAFNIEDRFYIGATLGVYDLKYNRYTSYMEYLNDDEGYENGGYTLENYYRMEGTGVDFKLGVIVRPFENSPFRLGLAVHTPTWYDLSESYDATINSDITYWNETYSQTLSDKLNPDYLIYDYRMVTPWKFNVSMGTTIDNLVAIGAEYEYQDYSSAQLKDIDGFELGGQADVNEFLKGVHTLRVGMEARLAPQFSVRAGYNYSTAAFQDYAYNQLSLYGTNTDFNNTKSKNTCTLGLGYKGSSIYADIAYKYDMYKSDFCAFDSNYNFSTGETDLLPAAQVDNSRHQLILTLGARF